VCIGMATDGTVELTIVYAASGSFLTSLAWPAAGSVSSLQRELQKHTPTGAVGDLLSTTGPLAGDKTLSELGITTGAVLEAVLTFDPSPMYLVNPEVTEYLLLFRHDASKKWVYNMDIAPAEAQRIVAEMRPVSGGFPGIPIVLSRPGENPVEACYQALGLHESLRKHMSQTWLPKMTTRELHRAIVGLDGTDSDGEDWETDLGDLSEILNESLRKHFRVVIKHFAMGSSMYTSVVGGYTADDSVVGLLCVCSSSFGI